MNKGLKDIQPKGRLNPAGLESYKLPEWVALIGKKKKNTELMGNNLWYCDSVKYKYKTQKVRVTYAWVM